MTVLVIKLTPVQAKAVARVADQLGMTHEEVGREAVKLFTSATKPTGKRKR